MKKILFVILFSFFLISCNEVPPIVTSACDITNEICDYAQLICDQLTKNETNTLKTSALNLELRKLLDEMKYYYQELKSGQYNLSSKDRASIDVRLIQIKEKLKNISLRTVK